MQQQNKYEDGQVTQSVFGEEQAARRQAERDAEIAAFWAKERAAKVKGQAQTGKVIGKGEDMLETETEVPTARATAFIKTGDYVRAIVGGDDTNLKDEHLGQVGRVVRIVLLGDDPDVHVEVLFNEKEPHFSEYYRAEELIAVYLPNPPHV